MPQTQDLQRGWARIGAKARLAEIDRETAEIYAAFPELRGNRGRGPAVTTDSAPRPRRTLSASARKAMSQGMRKYWAKRKADARK